MEAATGPAPEKLAGDLSSGIEYLGLTVGEAERERLLAFLQLLVKWNRVYNLSGIREPERMLRLHVLDSLSILPFIDGKVVVDVGSGGGLPGIVLAICRPRIRFHLVDSNGKKTRFLFQAKVALALANVAVAHQRVEDFRLAQPADIVVSRAFSTLAEFAGRTRHLLGDKSKLLAMKGLYPEQEIAVLPEDFTLTNSHGLTLPGERDRRHLLEITRHQRNTESKE